MARSLFRESGGSINRIDRRHFRRVELAEVFFSDEPGVAAPREPGIFEPLIQVLIGPRAVVLGR